VGFDAMIHSMKAQVVCLHSHGVESRWEVRSPALGGDWSPWPGSIPGVLSALSTLPHKEARVARPRGKDASLDGSTMT